MPTDPEKGNYDDPEAQDSFSKHFEKFGDTSYSSDKDQATQNSGDLDPTADEETKKELDDNDLASAEDEADEEVDTQDSDELSGATGRDYYKDDPDNKVRFSDKFSFKNVKKNDFWDISSGGRRIFAMAGIAGLLMSMVVGLLMFMTIYRSEHIRNLLWDYRFAKFHYQIGKRINANLKSIETLDPASTDTLQFEKTSLGQKLRGFSPEEAISSLSEGKVKLTVEKGGLLGESKITGYTDPKTGDRIISSNSQEARSGSIAEGTKVVDSATFDSGLKGTTTAVLEEAGHTKFFQRQTRKLLSDKVNVKFGDRIRGWKEKLKGEATKNNTTEDKITDEERQRLLAEEDLKTARAGKEGPVARGSTEEAARAVEEDLKNGATTGPDTASVTGTPSPGWATSETRAKLANGAGKIGKFSKAAFYVTMGCIVRDLSGSIVSALSTRIDAPMRAAANALGEGEQQKAGGDGASLEYAKQRNKDYENIDKSAAFQRQGGTPEDQIQDSSKLELADFPLKFMGFDLRDVSNVAESIKTAIDAAATGGLSLIPGIGAITGDVVDFACKQVLRPEVQIGIAIIETVGAFLSIGSSEVAGQAAFRTLETVFSVAAGVGIGKIMFEYLIPKMLFSLTGSGGMMSAGDLQNGNKLDMGTTLLASQYGSMSGGGSISLAQAERDQDIAIGLVKKQKVDQMGIYAYISPANPYSLTSQLALSLPGDPMKIPGALITKSFGLLFSKDALSSLANIISPKAKAASESTFFETYGVPQTGISDQMMSIDEVQNALYIENSPGGLEGFKQKYQKCFTDSLSQKTINSGDYGDCDTEPAQRLGLYNIDNCAGAGMLADGVTPNNCSVLDGSGDVIGQGDGGVGATTPVDGGAASDKGLPNYADTSPCPSDPNIVPADSGTAQRNGKTVNFTLCRVNGVATVNTVYAKNFSGLFTKAKADGFDLAAGGGSYLPYDQALIRWNSRCPGLPNTAPYSSPPCTGNRIAPPGKSNHELGLATDLTCNGGSLGGGTTTRATFNQNDPCVKWVIDNSPSFGLYLMCIGTTMDGCESWHLSPTGG